jgi:hypothetical protein
VKTLYDLVTTILFAGLAVLYLQRSSSPGPSRDKIVHYGPPAFGCALANWLGNHEQPVFAGLTIVAVVAYSIVVLKPFTQAP